MSDFYRNMLVTVTGGSGMNGSYIVKALVEAGAKVRAVVHSRPPNEYTKLAHEIVNADLSNEDDARRAVEGSEIVFHAAGVTGGVGLAINDPSALVTSNTILTVRVLDACAKENVRRFCFLSSTSVYPASDKPVREDQAWSSDPHDMYFGIAWVKRFGEKLCEFYSKKYRIMAAIVRSSGTYGRYDSFDENTSHVIPAFVRRGLAAVDPFVVWGDGTDVRDFTHASDMANGVLLAVEKDARCDPVNIASAYPCTTKELAEVVLQVLRSKARIKFDKSKPTAMPIRMVDISKARKLLGFKPAMALKDGIADTVEWYRGIM